jgi:GTP-binding protein YchF
MEVGLVGFPLAGRTTLFNAITGLHKAGDAQVHRGAIKVPDKRLDQLAAIYKPRRVTYGEVRLVDLPGPRGKGLDADSLRALAGVDALCLVLRGFAALNGAAPEPLRELRDFDAELLLADLAAVERRLDRLRKEHAGRTGGEFHELSNLRAHLEGGEPLRTMSWTDAEQHEMLHFGFLSRRPMLVVLNVSEQDAARPTPLELEVEVRAHGAEAIVLSAEVEAEISELDPSEQPAFLESLGLSEPARDRFIRAVHHLLDLISFFTAGEDEVRAWTVHRGDRAPRAAGRIHADLERGFTRAEVIHYDDFLAGGGEAKARERGKLRLEGKEYVVRDGDILGIRTAG